MNTQELEQSAFKCAVEMEMPFNVQTIAKAKVILGYLTEALAPVEQERDELKMKLANAELHFKGLCVGVLVNEEMANKRITALESQIARIEKIVGYVDTMSFPLESQIVRWKNNQTATVRENALREAIAQIEFSHGNFPRYYYIGLLKSLLTTPGQRV